MADLTRWAQCASVGRYKYDGHDGIGRDGPDGQATCNMITMGKMGLGAMGAGQLAAAGTVVTLGIASNPMCRHLLSAETYHEESSLRTHVCATYQHVFTIVRKCQHYAV